MADKSHGCAVLAIGGLILLIIGRCSGPSNEYVPEVENAKIRAESTATGFDTPSLPANDEGDSLPVSSDPSATYRLLKWSKMRNGNVEALTRRDGSSGTSFARREIDCASMTFRYLAEGVTRAEAEEDNTNIGEMGELTPGSISTEVSQFVCRKTAK